MKLRSNVCNRCRLVRVKFYINRISFAVVIAKCLGGSLFGTHCINCLKFILFAFDLAFCERILLGGLMYGINCLVIRF